MKLKIFNLDMTQIKVEVHHLLNFLMNIKCFYSVRVNNKMCIEKAINENL